jgi:hypothetical protein
VIIADLNLQQAQVEAEEFRNSGPKAMAVATHVTDEQGVNGGVGTPVFESYGRRRTE